MSFKLKPKWGGTVAAALTVLTGLLLGVFPGWRSLILLSYDLPSRIHPSIQATNVLILEIDEETYQQHFRKNQDRSIHAGLLDHLKNEGARAVIFDIFFDVEGTGEGDKELARAIRSFGPVALACKAESHPSEAGPYVTTIDPIPLLATNAALLGIGGVPQIGSVVRTLHPGIEEYPSLSWAAAELAGAEITRNSNRDRLAERWLNYYGDLQTIPMMPYTNAWEQPSGVFRDKIIFIGGGATPGMPGEVSDKFGTPFARWDQRSAPGVRFVALGFLNLWRGDWLTRPTWDGLIFLITGVVVGYGLSLMPARSALWVGGAAMIATPLIAYTVFIKDHVWFPWMIIMAGQIPCALGCKLISKVLLAQPAPAPSAETLGTATVIQSPSPSSRLPQIPDHEVLGQIGAGAYGHVWLARNIIGEYHAVKVIHRDAFSSEEPYERAFHGIKTFMPLSRSHPNFVHLLHAGRNTENRYFFYIMEVADDLQTGQQIAPQNYQPRSLAADLRQRSVLSPRESVALVLDLAKALICLHGRKLIHRDIKPANIIYVRGVAKLADIDLVTELRTSGSSTYIGTVGYMPEQGVGTPAGDIYSLGKVLYVACTGRQPEQCPDLPSEVEEDNILPMIKLNEIVQRACEENIKLRYQSAQEFHDALLAWSAMTSLSDPSCPP